MATDPQVNFESSGEVIRGTREDGEANRFPVCVVRVLKRDNGFVSFGRTTVWKVLSCRVALTRYWASSTAEFKLAWTPGPDGTCFAVQPPPIAPEDLVEIFMGYSDELGCDPPELINSPKDGGLGYHQLYTTDPVNKTSLPIASGIFTMGSNGYFGIREEHLHMNKVFHGVVDSDGLKLGSGQSPADGIVLTVTCRDTLRYLINNKFSAELNVSAGENEAVPREEIIKALILQGGGVLNMDIPGPVVAAGTYQCGYKQIGELTSVERSGRAEIKLGPFDSKLASSYLVLNKFPKDVIQHFSTVDTRPMELYASNKTGAIYWTQRYIKGLDREKSQARSSRQYAYMTPFKLPNGRWVQPNIISGKLDWSTVATVTNFTLINPLSSSSQNKSEAVIIDAKRVGASADTKYLTPFRPFVVNRFIFDDTLTSAGDARDKEAFYVLQAMLDTFAKDIRGGLISVVGDPDIEIGEAAQLFNTGLFSEECFRIEAVTHMFAMGGTQTAYVTAMALASPEAYPIPSSEQLPGNERWDEAPYFAPVST